MLTVAVVSTDRNSISRIRGFLQQTGLVQVIKEWTSDVDRHPSPGEPIPDVVILDLNLKIDAHFSFAAHLRRLRPSICIIALSTLNQPSSEILMQAMRSGVQEFLPQPVNARMFQTALERYIAERGPAEEAKEKKLIVVMGAKGGVGSTTVAVNLGVQLSQLTKKPIALLDLARPVGHAALLLDLHSRFSVRDALAGLDRLDSHFLTGLLVGHQSGLQILPGVSEPEAWPLVDPASLARVVNVAQSTFNLVLLDVGSAFPAEATGLLKQLHSLLLVTESSVPALWNLERHLAAFSAHGMDPSRCRIVINRWHRDEDTTLKAFEKKTNRQIFARLPNDYSQVSEAITAGAPLSRNHHNPLVSNYKLLASRLTGIKPAVEAKKGAIFSFFPSLFA